MFTVYEGVQRHPVNPHGSATVAES